MSRTSRILSLAAALLLMGAGTACTWRKKAKKAPQNTFTSGQLLDKGRKEMLAGKWNDGRRTLRILEEQLPGTREYAEAKLLLADSFFFQGTPSYPEAAVEYEAFLNYFPRHDRRDYALYHLALCQYASIESAERDQMVTQKALDAFDRLVREAPGSSYVPEAKARLTQCWRRIAEHEVAVGIFYVNSYHFDGAENRLKAVLEKFPDFVDRERAYYYLGEALRQKYFPANEAETFRKAYFAKIGKGDTDTLTPDEVKAYVKALNDHATAERKRYRDEAQSFYAKLVESYPGTEWARRAQDRLLELGQKVKEGLDS